MHFLVILLGIHKKNCKNCMTPLQQNYKVLPNFRSLKSNKKVIRELLYYVAENVGIIGILAYPIMTRKKDTKLSPSISLHKSE